MERIELQYFEDGQRFHSENVFYVPRIGDAIQIGSTLYNITDACWCMGEGGFQAVQFSCKEE